MHDLSVASIDKLRDDGVDEDEPPPLEDMTGLLQKMHMGTNQGSAGTICPTSHQKPSEEDVHNVPKKILRRTEDKTTLVAIEASNPVLITTNIPKAEPPPPSKPLKPFKRGFLNAPLNQAKLKEKKTVKEEIPLIRPTKPKGQHSDIPEFLRVQDSDRIALQKEIRDMLEPTQELVKDVMETTDIKNGLEDPEIMAAVSEIAGNPDAMLKYKHNKKVTAFYNQLGILLKDRMNEQDKVAATKEKRNTKPK